MTHKSPGILILDNSIPQKKMIPEKIFESAIPKKVNTANLPLGKIYLEIDPWKKSQSTDPLDFYVHTHVMDKKWNSPIKGVELITANFCHRR